METYRIDEFLGIDQSRDENSLPSGMSPDACNMDTDNGALAVAKGYVRHIAAPIPGEGTVHRLYAYSTGAGDRFIAIAGDTIYAYDGSAWTAVYTYGEPLENYRFDFVRAQINSVDYVIIGCGERQMVKFDGTAATLFGSSANVSDIHTLFMGMYRSRLFAAGNPEFPNRLYWSQLPGDDRSIDNWGPYQASANVEGGHAEVGGASSDTIVGLAALSNQLLIFRERSIFRLIGDKPSNYIIEEVPSRTESAAYTSCVKCGDAIYFMTAGGLCSFNGVAAQTTADARRIRTILETADVSLSKGALCRDKLYFSFSDSAGGGLIEYDLVRGVYMLRRGFETADITSLNGTMYIVNSSRYVCRFNEGDSYDGAPISAWWRTPVTDMRAKSIIKCPRWIYLRGGTDAHDAATILDVDTGTITKTYRLLLPSHTSEVLEVKLSGECRALSLKLYNEAGGRWSVVSGVEMSFAKLGRTI